MAGKKKFLFVGVFEVSAPKKIFNGMPEAFQSLFREYQKIFTKSGDEKKNCEFFVNYFFELCLPRGLDQSKKWTIRGKQHDK